MLWRAEPIFPSPFSLLKYFVSYLLCVRLDKSKFKLLSKRITLNCCGHSQIDLIDAIRNTRFGCGDVNFFAEINMSSRFGCPLAVCFYQPWFPWARIILLLALTDFVANIENIFKTEEEGSGVERARFNWKTLYEIAVVPVPYSSFFEKLNSIRLTFRSIHNSHCVHLASRIRIHPSPTGRLVYASHSLYALFPVSISHRPSSKFRRPFQWRN